MQRELPRKLVFEFEMEVRGHLIKKHRIDADLAEKCLGDYLELAERHGFDELLYHRDPADVAATIAGAAKQKGFHPPKRRKASKIGGRRTSAV